MEQITKKIDKLKKLKVDLGMEIKERTVGYILAALGLVAGLAWNEAIKAAIDYFFPRPGNEIWIKFLYAGGVTLFAVMITVYLVVITKKEEK